MAQHWQEMLPIDRYEVCANGLLTEHDRRVITLLYQPLIGPIAASLYMTLWAQLEEYRLTSEASSHHSLMSIMNLSLRDIYDARLKLEGIGLLSSYVRVTDGTREFVYELMAPLSPAQFFLDGMLNVFLYGKIGNNHYQKLKQFFSDQTITNRQGYQEVTRLFQDVYQSSVPQMRSAEMKKELSLEDDRQFFEHAESKSIQIDEQIFDFELMLAGLSENLVPRRAITKKVREAITKLSFLYGINPIDMKNLVLAACDENNNIEINELRKAARDWYQLQFSDSLPHLVDKVQPPPLTSASPTPQTQEEKLIRYLETTSPRQFLIDLSGGGTPAKADLQIIEDVMFQQKLPPGVVNVLVHYVLLKTDMKLTKNYVDKLASHWARKNISTVSEAMELAKKEQKQYIEWEENKQKAKKTPNKKKPIRTESLPEWFDQTNAAAPTSDGHQSSDLEAKRKALEEKLKLFKD